MKISKGLETEIENFFARIDFQIESNKKEIKRDAKILMAIFGVIAIVGFAMAILL